MTLDELVDEMRRLSGLLDDGLGYLRRVSAEWASSEDRYRCARARALLESAGTVSERGARADLATSKERRQAHLDDAMKQAALENVRARRVQVSALQSVLAAYRSEAEFIARGPREVVG